MGGHGAIGGAGAENRARESRVVHRVGVVLGLKAETVEAIVGGAAQSLERRGIGGGVKLHARLIGAEFHHAAALRFEHLGGEGGFGLRFVREDEGVVVTADVDQAVSRSDGGGFTSCVSLLRRG